MTRDEAVETYCAAWDEPVADKRSDLLRQVLAEDAIYTDPTVHTVGVAALVAHIAAVQARRPGSRLVVTSVLDTHHDVARFAWKRILADGTSLPEGIDFVEFAPDARLRRIIGFFGPLHAIER
jgi:hypothetical protein